MKDDRFTQGDPRRDGSARYDGDLPRLEVVLDVAGVRIRRPEDRAAREPVEIELSIFEQRPSVRVGAEEAAAIGFALLEASGVLRRGEREPWAARSALHEWAARRPAGEGTPA